MALLVICEQAWIEENAIPLFSMRMSRSISSIRIIETRKLSLSFRSFEKYSSALFTLLPRAGHATQPGSFTTFLLHDTRSFPCVATTSRTPSHRKRPNDSTEWFIRRFSCFLSISYFIFPTDRSARWSFWRFKKWWLRNGSNGFHARIIHAIFSVWGTLALNWW